MRHHRRTARAYTTAPDGADERTRHATVASRPCGSSARIASHAPNAIAPPIAVAIGSRIGTSERPDPPGAADPEHDRADGVGEGVPDAEHRHERGTAGDAAPDDHGHHADQAEPIATIAGVRLSPERVVTARASSRNAPYGIQAERQRRHACREQRGTGLGGTAERRPAAWRQREHHHARPTPGSRGAPYGRASTGSSRRTCRAARGRVVRHLREHRRVQRLREHGVRREEEHERHLVRHHAARDAVARDARRAEQQARRPR